MLATVRLLVLLLWVGLIPACRGYVDWIYPGEGDHDLTFNYVDVVYFTWASSLDKIWMNLWCSPSSNQVQSTGYVYHQQVPTNGFNPQSFPYSDYNEEGVCHMQVENFSGDDGANTHNFSITSNDIVGPKTWGIAALGEAGGDPDPSRIQELPNIPSTLLAMTTSVSTSTASTASSTSSFLTSLASLSDISSTLLATSASVSPLSASAASSSSSSSSSSLLSSTSSSPSFTSLTSFPTTALPPPQPSVSSNTNHKITFTPAAKAGISSGILSFFIAIILMLWWSRRQRQRAQPQIKEHYGASPVYTQDQMGEAGGGWGR